MAFNGSLVKVGSYDIDPYRFIGIKTYKFQKNVIDVNSRRNGNGKLRRNTLKHQPNTVRFCTPPLLTNYDIKELFDQIAENCLDEIEDKYLITAYNPRADAYETQEMYMVWPEFLMDRMDGQLVFYDPIEILFTGY